MSHLFSWWIAEGSAHAAQVDLLLAAFTALTILLSAPVFILMAVFAVKYRRGKPADRAHAADRNVWIEISWSIIPFVLIVGFYVWSTELYAGLASPPAGAMQIDVVAKQWMWKFQHPGGQGEIDELHVPVDQPIKLVMSAQDTIHSLYIPALRIKQDVVPGRISTMWFIADKPGVYTLTCAEFCGLDHATMGGRFVVLTATDYELWLEQATVDRTLAAAGAALFRSRGCSGCHEGASTVRAPSLRNLYGGAVPLSTGEVVTADEQYLHDSIVRPHAQVAAGYQDLMPSFDKLLSEREIIELVAYIKSLRVTEAARP